MRRIGQRGDPALVEMLDWPRRKDAKIRKRFARFLTKGGGLPGVITEASYVKYREGAAVALFLRNLPPDVEQTLERTFTQQVLIAGLAASPQIRKRAAKVLASH